MKIELLYKLGFIVALILATTFIISATNYTPDDIWNMVFSDPDATPASGDESIKTTAQSGSGVDGSSDVLVTAQGAEYTSPNDFTAAFTSGNTITLSSLLISITDDSQIAYIKVVPVATASPTALFVNGAGGVSLRESADVITIYGAGTAPFVTGDVYEVGLNGKKDATALMPQHRH